MRLRIDKQIQRDANRSRKTRRAARAQAQASRKQRDS